MEVECRKISQIAQTTAAAMKFCAVSGKPFQRGNRRSKIGLQMIRVAKRISIAAKLSHRVRIRVRTVL